MFEIEVSKIAKARSLKASDLNQVYYESFQSNYKFHCFTYANKNIKKAPRSMNLKCDRNIWQNIDWTLIDLLHFSLDQTLIAIEISWFESFMIQWPLQIYKAIYCWFVSWSRQERLVLNAISMIANNLRMSSNLNSKIKLNNYCWAEELNKISFCFDFQVAFN